MTKEEFLKDYAERSGVTQEEILENQAPLPCACGDSFCEGWAMVSKDPIMVKAHMMLYAPKENNG